MKIPFIHLEFFNSSHSESVFWGRYWGIFFYIAPRKLKHQTLGAPIKSLFGFTLDLYFPWAVYCAPLPDWWRFRDSMPAELKQMLIKNPDMVIEYTPDIPMIDSSSWTGRQDKPKLIRILPPAQWFKFQWLGLGS